MAKVIAIALVAGLLTACAGSGPNLASSNSSMDNYWKDYGNSRGADANGG